MKRRMRRDTAVFLVLYGCALVAIGVSVAIARGRDPAVFLSEQFSDPGWLLLVATGVLVWVVFYPSD